MSPTPALPLDVDYVRKPFSLRELAARTAPEFRLLAYLMQHPGVTRTRQDIFRAVWGQDSGPRNPRRGVVDGWSRVGSCD